MAASSADLGAQARSLGLPEAAAICRNRSAVNVHDWDEIEPDPDDEFTPPISHPFVFAWRCRRCGAKVYRGMSRWGSKTRLHRIYPEGYTELGAIVRDDIQAGETYGQAATRAFLISRGLIKPTTNGKMPAKRREPKR